MLLHDIAGIGIGPFNLGLAALLSRRREVSALFLERKPEFRWHEGMILPGTTLQVPFLADLVTLADPTHPLSFLNYLRAHDRLYKFYFLEHFHIPRREYDDYCRWAARQLPACQFGETVRDVRFRPDAEHFEIESRKSDGTSRQYHARNLAIGIGTEPVLPAFAQKLQSRRIFHTSRFAGARQALEGCRAVAVVGSGQSAAECVLALLADLSPAEVADGARIHWISRSDGFFPMEYSKLGLEHFTPDYLNHFHTLPRDQRRAIVEGQGLLYKGISAGTISDIFDLLYERSIGGADPGLRLASACEVTGVALDGAGEPAGLHLRHLRLGESATIPADALVLGTGYRHVWPDWLERLKETCLATDARGDLLVGPDFTAERRQGGAARVFVQNAETFQHGVGAPDLGLGAYRNAVITNTLLGETAYRVDAPTAFQSFGLFEASPSTSSETKAYARAS